MKLMKVYFPVKKGRVRTRSIRSPLGRILTSSQPRIGVQFPGRGVISRSPSIVPEKKGWPSRRARRNSRPALPAASFVARTEDPYVFFTCERPDRVPRLGCRFDREGRPSKARATHQQASNTSMSCSFLTAAGFGCHNAALDVPTGRVSRSSTSFSFYS
jgi:hypothetical protein